jgi:hypothetical protein
MESLPKGPWTEHRIGLIVGGEDLTIMLLLVQVHPDLRHLAV